MSALSDETIRAFVAVTPPPDVFPVLREMQASLRRRLPSRALRWEAEDKWHVTMQFLGTIPTAAMVPLADALMRHCAGAPPPAVWIQGAGAFPSPRRPRVLWAGLGQEADALSELQRRVAAACEAAGLLGDRKAFHPHITLCRVKEAPARDVRPVAEALSREEDRRSERWVADCLEVYQSTLSSQGSRYERIREIRWRAE